MITPYCTLAQVKYALDLEKTKDDLWIEELIEEAQALLDRMIGYCFQQEGTPTEPAIHYYHGSGTPQLLIGACLEIVKVGEYVLPLDVFPSAGSWDITADCFLAPLNAGSFYLLERRSGIPFNMGGRNYQLQGVFGYASVPADITHACVRLATHFYKMRDTNYADFLAEQGAVRQKYVKQIPDDVQEIIALYRHRSFLCR